MNDTDTGFKRRNSKTHAGERGLRIAVIGNNGDGVAQATDNVLSEERAKTDTRRVEVGFKRELPFACVVSADTAVVCN